MYQVQGSSAVVAAHRRLLRRGGDAGARVPRTVVLLGLTSLLTDISSEMVAAVLPLYLVASVGFSPLQVGIIDGIYQGATALVRMVSGFLGDRWRRHKELATAGYGLSALAKPALLAAGGAIGAVAAIVAADRVGKGIRTAPRDAMISLAADESGQGAAFGAHRAMDTTGALLGPLFAFALLAAAPLAFDAIFVVSTCFAVLGVAVLVLLVPPQAGRVVKAPAPSLGRAARAVLARQPRTLSILAALLGLVTVSDAFVFLSLQETAELDAALFPLLFVGTAVTYMLLAAPFGRLADRFGRARMFLAGHVVLVALYVLLLSGASQAVFVVGALALLGVYYAATDGVLAALTAGLLPPELRGSGLSMVGTASSLGKLGGSIAFGAIWTAAGLEVALQVFGVALLVVLAVSARALPRGIAA